MKLNEFLLPEFLHETENTRKLLAALPEEHFDYRSNEKAMSLSELANHIAEIPTWIPATFLHSELDFATFHYVVPNHRTVNDLLAFFDKNINEALKLMTEVSNETLQENWTMRKGDLIYFTMPKISVYRMFVMNHTIHHRGQMTAYLRAVGAKVPGMYGPTADDVM
ncbi:DinB family protein [Flavobacterium enshiense]|uniref:DinB family protein n=1 Tax=Flavobacterium enshiense TaxID=1341165 RepID=UPI00345DBA58